MKNVLKTGYGLFLLACWLLCCTSSRLQAQSFEWKANAFSFFDNGEYRLIDDNYSQSMLGFRLSPEVGISYKNFSLFTGANLQTNFGAPEFINHASFIGYFQYKTEHHDFRFGAFPREKLLDNYTNFYIRDSFLYFRPNMAGIFYELSGENNFINVWLDWTGCQSKTLRETFFAGLSGEQRFNWFFISLLGYYYHYAGTEPISGDGCVHDNGQGQVTLGVDFSERVPNLHKLRFQAGYTLGYECKRDHQTPISMPMGLVLDLHAEYWRIGTRTLYRYGDPLYTVPTDNFSFTYWGNPFLGARSYLQSQWYVTLFRNSFVEAKAAFVFHLQGNHFGTQQMVQLSVNLNGSVYSKREAEIRGEKYRFNFIGSDKQEKKIDFFKKDRKKKEEPKRTKGKSDE